MLFVSMIWFWQLDRNMLWGLAEEHFQASKFRKIILIFIAMHTAAFPGIQYHNGRKDRKRQF